jgi:hypothetical protein
MAGYPGQDYLSALWQNIMRPTTNPNFDPYEAMRTPPFVPGGSTDPGGPVIGTAGPGPAPTPAPVPVRAGAPAPTPATAAQPPVKPPIVPYKGGLGSRLYQGIQDPRLQAFMLNMGNRLLQPPQFGESQAMRMGQGLISGYQGMNALSVLQTAKAKAAEEARMAREKHEADIAHTKAQTGKIVEEGKAIPAATAHKGREVSVLEAGQRLDELIKGGNLKVAEGQLSELIRNNDLKHDEAVDDLQAKKDKNASDAEIAKATLAVNARKIDSEILQMRAQSAKIQDDILNGRDATARIEVMKQHGEIIKSMIAAAPMGTDLKPYYDEAQKLLASVTRQTANPPYKLNVQSAVPAPGELATTALPPSFTAPPQKTVYDSQGNVISGGAPVPNQGPPASVPVAPIGVPAPTTAVQGWMGGSAAGPGEMPMGPSGLPLGAMGAAGPAPAPGAVPMARDQLSRPGSGMAGQAMGVESVAQAIAGFEGLGKEGSVAQRNNNPGNLKAGPGQVGTDEGGYAIFPDMQTGWAALRSHISRHSTEDLTLREYFGGKPGVYKGYAPKADKNDPENYASVVAKRLGVTPDTKLADVVGGGAGGGGGLMPAPVAGARPPARSPAASPTPATSKGPTPAPAGTVSKTPMVKGGPRMLTPEQTEQARQQLSRIPKPTRAKGEGPVEGWVDPRNGQVKWARNMTPARRAALRETGRVPLEEAAAKKERGPEVPYGSMNAPGLPGLP